MAFATSRSTELWWPCFTAFYIVSMVADKKCVVQRVS